MVRRQGSGYSLEWVGNEHSWNQHKTGPEGADKKPCSPLALSPAAAQTAGVSSNIRDSS